MKTTIVNGIEVGHDGKEWAKTSAAFDHIRSDDVQKAKIEVPSGFVWRGHVIREAFVAGAEWQEERETPLTVVCSVAEMKTSAGCDHYVHLRIGDREITPHMFKERWKAEYEVAEWKWFFEGGEKPDIVSYGRDPKPHDGRDPR